MGDKLSSGEALELKGGHWERCVAVGYPGVAHREKHRPGESCGRQSSAAVPTGTLVALTSCRFS